MHFSNYVKKQGYCLICFKDLNNDVSFSFLFSFNKVICNKCINKFKFINKIEFVNGIEATFLYEYDTFFKTLLYQYKGCYDIALKDVFLYKYKDVINKKYKGYTIIYPPSYALENNKRGFVHIKEIVSILKLKNKELFIKIENHKQSSYSYKNRSQISKYIKLKNSNLLTDKKYLIVDDVYTSGQTLKTIINILIKNKVKKENIKALILSKTPDSVEL